MSLQGEIIQVSLSKGGIPKLAVPEAWCGTLGLEGDLHRRPQFHGGPRKALLLMSAEDLDHLASLDFAVSPGAVGENLTVRGLDFRLLRSGMRFRAGGAVIELTKLRTPCSTLDIYNRDGQRIQEHLHDSRCKAGDVSSPRWAIGGIYASILQPGLIRTGDILELLDVAV